MKKCVRELLKERRLVFDGGMGSLLLERGLKPGEPSEQMNRSAPQEVRRIHLEYLKSGADIIKTNTFGINGLKYADCEARISEAVAIAKSAAKEVGRGFVALDVGPLGRMIKPLGDLDFESAVEAFAEVVRPAEALGCDLILIETVSDMYEVRAAVIAAKENSSLPIFVTCAYGSDGKLLTGADARGVVAMLEGLGVSALGVNCSEGPFEMRELVRELCEYSSLPVIVNPNAGLPRVEKNGSFYDLSPEDFACAMLEFARLGVSALGGCCGTTPKHISALCGAIAAVPYSPPEKKKGSVVCSFAKTVAIGELPLVVGERLNPTGKPRLKEALRSSDSSYLMREALLEEEEGAQILDLNVGLADIDEREKMVWAIEAIQSVCPLPLQIDSGRAEVLEAALRCYCGKAVVNSITADEANMGRILPIVKKYGGAVIALTMDESGIPETAEGRVELADKIMRFAKAFGIPEEDIIFDPLALTVASGRDNALVTLKAIELLKAKGYKCSLGVSNISFGLPARDSLNSAFYTAALFAGLDLAIINPHSAEMMNAYRSFLALSGQDEGCIGYIDRVRPLAGSAEKKADEAKAPLQMSLGYAIEKGLGERAREECLSLLAEKEYDKVINEDIIPALNRVGESFESKKIFLPNLLKSAEAASVAFDEIKRRLPAAEEVEGKSIILATVKGDIHDIGKNIVKLIFESYGYRVYDLGRDVPTERVLAEISRTGAGIVGLSALMTTTLPAMAETAAEIKKSFPEVKVIVGGAVLTEAYAESIGAAYAPDAISAVKWAEGQRKD